MSELTLFSFESNKVRSILVKDELFFCLVDVLFAIKSGTNPENAETSIKDFLGDEYVIRLNKSDYNFKFSEEYVFINEPAVTFLTSRSRTELGKKLNRWIHKEILPSIRKQGSYSVKPIKQQLTLPEIADSTQKMTNCINQFENSGDLQLAQLLKSTLGNLILAEQQNLLKPVEVEQYEGAVDVAIRLGFKVPANYEASLGMFVKKMCEHLLIGKNKRYSTASHKQVCANMYPAYNKEVESAVTEYCVKKSFYHRDINLLY